MRFSSLTSLSFCAIVIKDRPTGKDAYVFPYRRSIFNRKREVRLWTATAVMDEVWAWQTIAVRMGTHWFCPYSGCRYNLISLYDIVYHCPFSGLSQKIPEDYSVCFCVRAMQSAGRGQWIFYAFFFRFRCNMIIF